MKTVGIVGSSTDPNARVVADAVSRRHAEVLFIETDRVPRVPLDVCDDAVTFGGLPLAALKVVYVKSVHTSVPTVDPRALPHHAFATWQECYAAERERHSFITATLRLLATPERLFVNPVESFDLHFLKLHQLARLRHAGVDVPASLGTSDPESVRRFARRFASVVYKPFAGGALVKRLLPADLDDARLGTLRDCPVLFQEEIRGRELRAYVLDGQPVAAFELPTEGLTGEHADARVAVEQARRAELSPEQWSVCIRAARELSLVFTAVDLRLTAEGRLVVLEANPTPAISFFEDPRDGTVITRLADFLVARA